MSSPPIAHASKPALRYAWLAYAALVVLYLASRVPSLLSVPIFFDEAFYLLRAASFPERLHITLGAGKLLHELILTGLSFLPGDPLWNSRLFSVLCGLGVLILMQINARQLGVPVAGLVGGLLYTIAPNAVLHDRMGIPESMLTMMGLVVLLASIRYVQLPAPTRKDAALIGAALGGACLVKISGGLFAILPFLAVLFFNQRHDYVARLSLLRFSLIVMLIFLVPLAPFGFGNLERSRMGLEGSTGLFSSLGVNLDMIATVFWVYLPAPLLAVPVLFFGRFTRLPATPRRAALFLWSAGLLLVAAYTVVGHNLFPRYLLSPWALLLLGCGVALVALWHDTSRVGRVVQAGSVLAVALALAWGGEFIVRLQADPSTATLTALDRRQYLELWSAGYQMPALIDDVAALAAEAEETGIVVVAPTALGYESINRLIHIAPQVYLRHNDLVTFATVDITAADAADQFHALAQQQPTYILLDGDEHTAYRLAERFPQARLVESYTNPVSPSTFYIYQLTAPDTAQPWLHGRRAARWW